jgi:uncharacterized protein (TIGR02246 family)
MPSDKQQIRQLMDTWRERTATGDLDAVLALMTDDAIFLTPGNPPMSKTDFADGFRKLAGRVRIEATQEVKDLHTSGDIAYAWSYLRVAMTSLETGAMNERAGYVLTVFRKSAGGTWRLARDANLIAGQP